MRVCLHEVDMSGFPSVFALSSLDGTNGFRLDGGAAYDRSGWTVSSAGDVNGDGFDDVIVGASYASPAGLLSGSTVVVFGKASGFAADINLSSLDGTNGFRLDGASYYDYSGFSVSSAGDVNGDGFDDLVVGATYADPNGSNSGSSYVIFGQRAQAAVTITGTDQGLVHNGGVGDDTITGKGGNDRLYGWESNDTLQGGSGNDLISGGAGRDRMTGGGNHDVFVFEAITYSGTTSGTRDVITDFRVRAGSGPDYVDLIHVAGIDAMASVVGDQDFTFIGDAAFTGEGQIRAVQDGAHTNLQFNTTGNAGPEMIVVLRNFTATELTVADFIL